MSMEGDASLSDGPLRAKLSLHGRFAMTKTALKCESKQNVGKKSLQKTGSAIIMA